MRCWITVLTVLSLAVTGCTEGTTSTSNGLGLSTTTTVVSLTTTIQDSTTTSPPSVSSSAPEEDGEVPWGAVGSDWFLLLIEADGRLALNLTNPDGVSWELMSWPLGSLLERTIVDWSPDRRSVLLLLPAYEPVLAKELWLYDLPSGEGTLVESVPWSWATDLSGGFTRPTGRNLVVLVRDESGVRLERRSRDGKFLAVLADQPDGEMSWLYGPDGTTVVVADMAGVNLLDNTGNRLRSLMDPYPLYPDPSGDLNTDFGSCELVRWWSDDTALVDCWSRGSYAGARTGHLLWQVPIGDGDPVRVNTSPLDECATGPTGRPESAWATDLGMVVSVVCPVGVAEDGPRRLGLFDPSRGLTVPLVLIGSMGDDRPVGVAEDDIAIVLPDEGGGAASLVWAAADPGGSRRLVLTKTVVPTGVREAGAFGNVVRAIPYGSSAVSAPTPWLDEGWTVSSFRYPVSRGCCDQMDKAPQSPEFPNPGTPLQDGFYPFHVSDRSENPHLLKIEVGRWVACESQPDRCIPPISEGDAFTDGSISVDMTLRLDERLTVIVAGVTGLGAVDQVTGDGAALFELRRYADDACRWSENQDPWEAPGIQMVDRAGPVCRGPHGMWLSPYGETAMLEIRNGSPVLWVWWGQIAG